MIALTRLNGQQFVMNAEKIRYIEATPDTVVCCDTGERDDGPRNPRRGDAASRSNTPAHSPPSNT